MSKLSVNNNGSPEKQPMKSTSPINWAESSDGPSTSTNPEIIPVQSPQNVSLNASAVVPNPVTSSSFLTWDQVFLGTSFSLALALVSVSYQSVGGVLVPPLFVRNPILFQLFVILDACVFAVSIISIVLERKHRRINRYLFMCAYFALVADFNLLTWVLLPPYLRTIPIIFMVATVLVFFTLNQWNATLIYDLPLDSSNFDDEKSLG